MVNVIERKTAKSVTPGKLDSKGGKFAKSMSRLAKLRSKSRSKNPLQVGNVLTKKAPMKGGATYGSKVNKPEGSGILNTSKGQLALNPEQQ